MTITNRQICWICQKFRFINLQLTIAINIQSVYKRTYIKSPVELCGSIYFLAELRRVVEAHKLDVK
jgi:hypothetical protein